MEGKKGGIKGVKDAERQAFNYLSRVLKSSKYLSKQSRHDLDKP